MMRKGYSKQAFPLLFGLKNNDLKKLELLKKKKCNLKHQKGVQWSLEKERERGWVLKRPGEKEKSIIYIYITKKNVKKYIFVKCKAITKIKNIYL
jgi:hypothetical protein